MSGDQRDRVLMASPPARSAGGMATVAEALARSCDGPNSLWSCVLVDSGGGDGRRGYPRFGKALAEVARQQYDVLHLHVASKGSTARKAVLAEVAALRRIPYVIHLHGAGYVQFLDSCSPRLLAGVRRFYRHAARVIVLGESWRQLVVSSLGVPDERVRIVHNGVPPVLGGFSEARAVDPGSESVILFVGELGRRKGVDLLLDALTDIMCNERFSHVRAVLVGSAPDAELLRRARQLSENHGERVEITGPLFGEAKAVRFARAAVLVLPSRSEALPMALLEAMSATIPCITTNVGSIEEIFPDGRASGAVVLPRADADLLREALICLMANPEERRRIGMAGRARWESAFTAQAMFEGVQRCWTEATDGGALRWRLG